MKYESMKPGWEVAMVIHGQALANQDTPYDTKRGAMDEIVRAGRLVDTMQGDIKDLLARLPEEQEVTKLNLSLILSGKYVRSGEARGEDRQ